MVNLINETVCIKYKGSGIFSLAFGFTFFMYTIAILIPFLIVFTGSGIVNKKRLLVWISI
jgi:hypothetical protein